MLKRVIPILLILMLIGCGSTNQAAETPGSNTSTVETDIKEETEVEPANTITVGDYTADIPSSWINNDTYYYMEEKGKPPFFQIYLADDQNMRDIVVFKDEMITGVLNGMENGELVSDLTAVEFDKASGYAFSVKGGLEGIIDNCLLTVTLFENPSGGVVYFNMLDTGIENLSQYTTLMNSVQTDVPFNTADTGAQVSNSEPGNAVDSNEIAELIDVNYSATADGYLCVFIKNNSDVVVDEIEVQALFKDDAGVTISTDRDGHDMVLPGYTVVSRIKAPDEYADVVFEKNIEIGVHPNYKNHSQEVQLEAHDGSDGIIVEITNNSDVSIDEIEYVVVYYQGDQIVSVSFAQDVYHVDPGKTVTEEISPWGIEYDKYEIYLNQAHTFGF